VEVEGEERKDMEMAEDGEAVKQEASEEVQVKSEPAEEGNPWSTDVDEQGMDEDRGVADDGEGEGWTEEGRGRGGEGEEDEGEGEGYERRDEDEGEGEEEVEHGFAAVDDDTADPTWS
jgi:hypothetical protein